MTNPELTDQVAFEDFQNKLIRRAMAERLHKAQGYYNKIDCFATLQKGWDSYNAEPPSQKCINEAKFVINRLSILPHKVSPSVIGGIGISWKYDDNYIYLEIYNDGEKYITHSNRKDDIIVEEIKS